MALSLNILRPVITPHSCYILVSATRKHVYVGYTVNFSHRLRQHNGELVGGAKKTHRGRPWSPLCIIKGFYEASSSLRFEYRLQHMKRNIAGNATVRILSQLRNVITTGDGCIAKNNKMPWPLLTIQWYEPYYIHHARVINEYIY